MRATPPVRNHALLHFPRILAMMPTTSSRKPSLPATMRSHGTPEARPMDVANGRGSTFGQTAHTVTPVALRSVRAESTRRRAGMCTSLCTIRMVACTHACSEQVGCSGKLRGKHREEYIYIYIYIYETLCFYLPWTFAHPLLLSAPACTSGHWANVDDSNREYLVAQAWDIIDGRK